MMIWLAGAMYDICLHQCFTQNMLYIHTRLPNPMIGRCHAHIRANSQCRLSADPIKIRQADICIADIALPARRHRQAVFTCPLPI